MVAKTKQDEQYRNFRERTLPPSHRGLKGSEDACRTAFERYMDGRTIAWGFPDLTPPKPEGSRP